MTKRKAYQLKAGNINDLKIQTSELEEPQDHEVCIEVKSIGLNFADIFAIWGLYAATPEGVFTPGLEYSGIVLKAGKKVSNVKVGDRIMGITRFGGYATHLNIDSSYVLSIPSGWTFEEGAGFLVQVLTAYYALFDLGNIQKGQTILVHSAAGGVGIYANRIAKKMDCYTIGSVGNESKLAFLKKEGYDAGIVRGKDFKEKLVAAVGDRELAIIMECIGGDILKIGFDVMASMGRMIVYGSAQYAHPANKPNKLKLLLKYIRRPKLDPQNMTNLNKSVMAFNLIFLYEKVEVMQRILNEIAALDLEKPHIGHRFSFDELPDAIRLFLGGKTMGKVVVNVS